MARADVTVGNLEKHKVVVNVSTLTGDTKIWIDGKEVPDSAIEMSGYAPDFNLPTKTYQFGERERHRIDIEFSPGVTAYASIFIDGKLVSR